MHDGLDLYLWDKHKCNNCVSVLSELVTDSGESQSSETFRVSSMFGMTSLFLTNPIDVVFRFLNNLTFNLLN